MKRFAILLLCLLALGILKAEKVAEAKAACKCEEGQKDCPCLAQSAEDDTKERLVFAAPPPASPALRGKRPMSPLKPGMKPMVRVHKLKTKRAVHVKKANILKAKLAVVAKKAAKLAAIAHTAPPHAKMAIKKQQMKTVRMMQHLKVALKRTKMKVRLLSHAIKKAPLVKRQPLLVRMKAYKDKCGDLRRKIKVAMAQIKAMKEAFVKKCILSVKKKAIKAAKVYHELKVKVVQAKTALKKLKLKIKQTPPAFRASLIPKLKILKKVYVTVKKKAVRAQKVAVTLKIKVQRIAIKLEKKKIKAKKVELRILQRKTIKIERKIRITFKKIHVVKVKLAHTPPQSPKAVQLQRKLKRLVITSNLLKTKLKATKNSLKPIAKLIQLAKVKVHKMVVNVKKGVTATRCTLLQRRLERELLLFKRLKQKFARQCQKAATDATKANIAKLRHTQTKMDRLQGVIDTTKAKLRLVPKALRPVLVKVIHKMKLRMRNTEAEIRATMAKIAQVKANMAYAKHSQKSLLISSMDRLKQRLLWLQQRLPKVRNKYLLLKLKYKKMCEAQINKEKTMVNAYMTEIAAKLKLVQDRAAEYTKSMALLKKEAMLKMIAERLKQQKMQATNDLLKKKLERKIRRVLASIVKVKEERKEAKRKAIVLQKQLELKAQDVLKKERAMALQKEEVLKKKMAECLKKMAAIRKGMKEAHNVNIRTALASQKAAEAKRLFKYRSLIKLAAAKAKSAKVELALRKKAITTEEKEAAMKRALIIKKEQKLIAQLKIKWDHDAEEDLSLTLRKLRAVFRRKIALLKKLLVEAKLEQQAFTKESRILYKRNKTLEIEKLTKIFSLKIAKLKKKIAKAQADLKAYKAKAIDDLAKKERALNKKAQAKLRKMIVTFEAQLAAEVQRQKRLLMTLKVKLKQDLIKTKAELEQKVMTIMSRIAAMKAEMLKREAALQEKLASKKAEGQELRVSLSAAKEELAQKEGKFKKTKKRVMARNKQELAKHRELDAKEIAEAKASMAKLRAFYQKKEALLSTEVEKASSEVARFSEQLKEQRKEYATLQAEFLAEKTKLQKKHDAMIAEEKKKMMETEAEMKATLESCALKTHTLQEEVAHLKVELKSKVSHIIIIKDQAAKRKALADVMTATETQLREVESKTAAAELLQTQTCSQGTPGPWLRKRCEQLRNSMNSLKSEAQAFEAKLKQYREKYSSI